MIVIDSGAHYILNGKPVRSAHLLHADVGRDAREELVAFARGIGMRADWLQRKGTEYEHFDCLNSRIAKARDAGAILVDRRRLVAIIRRKRELMGLQRVPRAVIRARSDAREILGRA